MAGSSRAGAIAWMLVTSLLFVAVTGIVRHLGSDLPAVQAAFLRYVIGLGFMLPFLYRTLRVRPIPRRLGLHVLRGVVHGGGVILWFFAMARIPIAEVTAIGFTAPLFTTIGAVLFLGETLRARRIAAVIAGFLGTVIILRPGIEAIHIGALAQLAAAPLFACSFIVAKKLTETESGSVIVAWLSLFVTLALLPPALLSLAYAECRGASLAHRHRRLRDRGPLHAHPRDASRRADHAAAVHLPAARLGKPARIRRVRRGARHLDLGGRHGSRHRRDLHRPPRGARAAVAPAFDGVRVRCDQERPNRGRGRFRAGQRRLIQYASTDREEPPCRP